MKNLSIVILITAFLSATAQAAGAINYNNQGMEEYRNKNYQVAIELFKKAIDQNSSNALAHYNLACSLNLNLIQNQQDGNGFDNTVIRQIFEHLQKAINLNAKRKSRALEDPDLRSLSNYSFFRKLKGELDFDSSVDTEAMLSAAWRSSNQCGGGLFDDALVFDASGKVYAGCRNVCAGEEYDLEKCVIGAGYKVNKASIILTDPSSRINTFEVYFDGLESHIRGIAKDGKVLNEWHEYSGYYGSP